VAHEYCTLLEQDKYIATINLQPLLAVAILGKGPGNGPISGISGSASPVAHEHKSKCLCHSMGRSGHGKGVGLGYMDVVR